MKRRLTFGIALGAVMLASMSTASAQKDEEELDRTPEECVYVDRISRDFALDNRTILFYMRGGLVFRNDLPFACAPLVRGESEIVYNYRTGSVRLTRVCNTDTISVENTPNVTCRLGLFLPITKDEAAALENPAEADQDAAAGDEEN